MRSMMYASVFASSTCSVESFRLSSPATCHIRGVGEEERGRKALRGGHTSSTTSKSTVRAPSMNTIAPSLPLAQLQSAP